MILQCLWHVWNIMRHTRNGFQVMLTMCEWPISSCMGLMINCDFSHIRSCEKMFDWEWRHASSFNRLSVGWVFPIILYSISTLILRPKNFQNVNDYIFCIWIKEIKKINAINVYHVSLMMHPQAPWWTPFKFKGIDSRRRRSWGRTPWFVVAWG